MSSGGFFFDVERWFGSIAVQRMSFAEKGVYLSMLFQQWRSADRSLPDDAKAVADLIAITDAQAAEVMAAWPAVRSKFVSVERRVGRIQNIKIEETRRKQARNRQQRVESGRSGGKASAAKRKKIRELDSEHRLSGATATPSDAVANSSDLIRLDRNRSDQIRSEEETRASALPPTPTLPVVRRVGKPDSIGGRVFLHRWQLDELIAALGPHADAFELDAWISGLTDAANAQGVTFPTKETRWAWVQAELAGEMKRRGLPVAGEVRSTSIAFADYDTWSADCGRLHGGTCGNYTTHTVRLTRERLEVSA